MNDPLVMLEEEIKEKTGGNAYLVIDDSWARSNNVITIPKKDVLRLVVNLLIQADIG